MKYIKTYPTLIILFLVSSTILIAYPSGALAASNPSVPNFTVQYVDHSYDVPITYWYSTDPFTGQQITHSSGGNHVDNRTIDVTIHDQQFTPYSDGNHTVYLYYNIRSKGHFADWNSADSGSQSQNGIQASADSDTIVSFFIQSWDISPGGQIDFQVQAVLSYTSQSYSGGCNLGSQTISVAQSDWSNTQTITVGNPIPATTTEPSLSTPSQPTFNPYFPNSTSSPAKYPNATPIQPGTQTGSLFGFDWVQTALIVMAVVIAVLVAALVLVMWRKNSE